MFLLPVVLIHGYTSIVTSGQAIHKGEVLAKRTTLSAYSLNIAQILGVSLRKVKSCLRKHPGEAVRRGDVLAEKAGVLGMAKEKIISEVNGVVYQFVSTTGELIIQTEFSNMGNAQTLISPLDGMISICDNEKIVIQTEAPVIVAKEGSGHPVSGELHVLTQDHSQEIKYYDVDVMSSGKVILGGQVTKDTLVKVLGMKVLGIITAHIAQEDISYAQQKYSLPILVVHEFDYQSLKNHHGEHVYIDGLSKSIVI